MTKIKKKVQKRTTVKAHPRKVPISKKNPDGLTIVDKHTRQFTGVEFDLTEIQKSASAYSKKGIPFPTSGKLKHKNADKYDDLIAIWTDFFNKKFPSDTPLEPDVIKALIASESGFRTKTPDNPVAFGIMQITKQTLKALQDRKGEAKEFIFKDFTIQDLENPEIAIPMGIRWLLRKKRLAQGRLGREPNAEEVILEYKGMLESKTDLKDKALRNFKDNYNELKK